MNKRSKILIPESHYQCLYSPLLFVCILVVRLYALPTLIIIKNVTIASRIDKSSLESFNRVNDKYQDIIEKYPYTSLMLLELVYPQFLRELYY
jgi:hypothetical protein